MAALGFVHDYLGRGFAHFKLGAHLLDLRGLLFQLGRELRSLFFELRSESRYLFLLLRDRCLQLLNFVIEHGLVLELGARVRLRCVTLHRCARCATTLVLNRP